MPEDNFITASINSIDPNMVISQDISTTDTNIIPNATIDTTWSYTKVTDKIEFFIYDNKFNLLFSDYNYTNWSLEGDSIKEISDSGSLLSNLLLNPQEDCENFDIDYGEVNTIYNFISYQLNSSPTSFYFISEISSDRTELKLNINTLTNSQKTNAFNSFKTEVLDSKYFDEFYLNFGDNNYIIGVNAQLDQTTENYQVLIKLYEPLPQEYKTKTQLYVVTKSGESVGYKVSFPTIPLDFTENIPYLKGPNTNLDIKNLINNSTEYTTINDISSFTSTELTSSYYQLNNLINRKGIELSIDYSSSFNEFVFLSSAKQRLENFDFKVGQIENYQNNINTIYGNIIGSTTSSMPISESVSTIRTKINDIIKNFDGWEYYLYYTSGSAAWPKSNTTTPYTLFSTGSTQVLNWLGSDILTSPFFGGMIESASYYDNENQNSLLYGIPEFIREDSDNANYDLFINMIGQHFDNMWIYTNHITYKLKADNRLDYGVSKDLVAEVLRSLGTKIYQNNFSIEGMYAGLLGITPSGSLLPPTGSELITNYITASAGPDPQQDIEKEIYKRIYHNLPYLLKKKGTTEGIRNLITLYGIPSTILRVSEFGGKDKDENDDYDYWYDRYSYAFNTRDSASVLIPWKPLKGDLIGDRYISSSYFSGSLSAIGGYFDIGGEGGGIIPDSIEFRFKSHGIPQEGRLSQSLFVVQQPHLSHSVGPVGSFDFGLFLEYGGSGSLSGSYSGSSVDPYNTYGNMVFYASQSGGFVSSSNIFLPFFDGGWWSVLVQKNTSSSINQQQPITCSIYAKNKIYTGWDGDSIGYQGSSSCNIPDNSVWDMFYTGSNCEDGLYLGGYISGSRLPSGKILHAPKSIFSGSFQEFRYLSEPLNETAFNDYTMNPESIEGNVLLTPGNETSFDLVCFRAPLGNELYDTFNVTSSVLSPISSSYNSMHPSVTASAPGLITQSFDISPTISSSEYCVIWWEGAPRGSYLDSQIETYYLDQPVAGLKNRATDKIKYKNENPGFGNVLSNQRSIEQYTPISQSYIRDVNLLEVAFSPQNEVNDDIIATYGYFNIGEFIGDPRFMSSSLVTYPDLDKLALDYFKKYYKKYDWYDYIRLIKYFDNSLFKMIKDYVPARTSVSTGVVIKQHLLERNRYRPPQVSQSSRYYTASIEMVAITGSAGGSVNIYNTASYSSSFFTAPGTLNVTQSWSESISAGVSGSVLTIHKIQDEFFNGEYSGSSHVVTTSSLNDSNPFLLPSYVSGSYSLFYYSSSYTNPDTFLSINTTPNPGEFFMFYDTGSNLI